MENKPNPLRLPAASLLQNLVGSLNTLVCALDTEGRFVFINRASLKILGYHPEELIGVSCFDLMVEADRKGSYQATRDAWQGADISTYENHYVHKDGRIITLFWEGGWDVNEQLLYTTGRDITEQRRLEKMEQEYQQQLRTTTRQLENLIERITDGFLGLDEHATVIYWNKAAESIAGFSQQQMVGNCLWDVLPEPSCSMARKKLAQIMQEKRPLHMVYFSERIRRWIEVHAYISESGVSAFFRDVSGQKQLEQQLLREREEHQHEKEQAQKKLTAAVIRATEQEREQVSRDLHDNVNQVLTTIKLYTELCSAKKVDPDLLLPKCTSLLNNTINEIRRLSKNLAASSLHTVGMTEAFRDLIESVRITQKLAIELDVSAFCCNPIDEELQLAVYRIAQEQLTNILKHANAAKVLVKLACTKTLLTLVVKDDGIGFNTNKKTNGIGITNMISRAGLFDGSFSLESEEGNGCTLTVSFPVTYAKGKCRPEKG